MTLIIPYSITLHTGYELTIGGLLRETALRLTPGNPYRTMFF
jgi:hypothetical protein